MRKPSPTARHSGFSLPMIAAFIVAAGGTVWYLMFKGGGDDGGQSLWPALGFKYGPIGNLASIGADFKTGANRFDGHNALPVTMYSALSNIPLTDTTGAQLTDVPGTVLTDANVQTNFRFPQFRNAASIRDTFNHSGSKPA